MCQNSSVPFVTSISTGGYTCMFCGAWVYPGTTHVCQNYLTPYQGYINPCDTCKLWDKCSKYRTCFEPKKLDEPKSEVRYEDLKKPEWCDMHPNEESYSCWNNTNSDCLACAFCKK